MNYTLWVIDHVGRCENVYRILQISFMPTGYNELDPTIEL